jgi:hypothetical protein
MTPAHASQRHIARADLHHVIVGAVSIVLQDPWRRLSVASLLQCAPEGVACTKAAWIQHGTGSRCWQGSLCKMVSQSTQVQLHATTTVRSQTATQLLLCSTAVLQRRVLASWYARARQQLAIHAGSRVLSLKPPQQQSFLHQCQMRWHSTHCCPQRRGTSAGGSAASWWGLLC